MIRKYLVLTDSHEQRALSWHEGGFYSLPGCINRNTNPVCLSDSDQLDFCNYLIKLCECDSIEYNLLTFIFIILISKMVYFEYLCTVPHKYIYL